MLLRNQHLYNPCRTNGDKTLTGFRDMSPKDSHQIKHTSAVDRANSGDPVEAGFYEKPSVTGRWTGSAEYLLKFNKSRKLVLFVSLSPSTISPLGNPHQSASGC
uniref:Uncharacterized protein n=1 Tax=Nothobranchius rachovii TaxID=451742 RepID=A0A1A8RUW3_9TELE